MKVVVRHSRIWYCSIDDKCWLVDFTKNEPVVKRISKEEFEKEYEEARKEYEEKIRELIDKVMPW